MVYDYLNNENSNNLKKRKRKWRCRHLFVICVLLFFAYYSRDIYKPHILFRDDSRPTRILLWNWKYPLTILRVSLSELLNTNFSRSENNAGKSDGLCPPLQPASLRGLFSIAFIELRQQKSSFSSCRPIVDTESRTVGDSKVPCTNNL